MKYDDEEHEDTKEEVPVTQSKWWQDAKTIAAYGGLITALCSGFVSIRNARTKSTDVRVDNVYEKLLESNLLLSKEVEKTQGQLYGLREYADKRDEEIRKAVLEQRPPIQAPVPLVDKPKPIVRRGKPKPEPEMVTVVAYNVQSAASSPAPTFSAPPPVSAASAAPPMVSSAPPCPPPPAPALVLPDKIPE